METERGALPLLSLKCGEGGLDLIILVVLVLNIVVNAGDLLNEDSAFDIGPFVASVFASTF